MLPHLLMNFEIQQYNQNEAKFKGIYSRKNLSKIKDGSYVLNLDEYKSIGTHLIELPVNGDDVTYFDSFAAEYIPKEIKKFTGNRNIAANIHRIKANN